MAELAADIAARGVLQPILVRPADEADQVAPARFVVIAGERRLRACRLAQVATVPAIIRSIDPAEHTLAQLAENIQRADLTTWEEAQAVRKIHDQGKGVTEIAALLHKSKTWVSKRSAASHSNLSWIAAKLLEDGVTEDLEIILTVDKLFRLDFYAAQQLTAKIRRGEAGRQTVRETYEAAAMYYALQADGTGSPTTFDLAGYLDWYKRVIVDHHRVQEDAQ